MKRGFTLIELMIVVAFFGIVAAIIIPMLLGSSGSATQDWQYGINGVTETRCIDGYKFVVSPRGYTQQMMNDKGAGIACK